MLSVWPIHQKCFSKFNVTRKLVIWRRWDQMLIIQNPRRLWWKRKDWLFREKCFFFMLGRDLERYKLFLGHVRKVEKHFQQKDSFGSGELKEQAQSDEKDVTDRKISDVSKNCSSIVPKFIVERFGNTDLLMKIYWDEWYIIKSFFCDDLTKKHMTYQLKFKWWQRSNHMMMSACRSNSFRSNIIDS